MCSTPAATTTSRWPAWIGGRAVESGLQRRPALAIDRRGADGLGPAPDEHRLPAHVERLLADLGHAAHLHVLDLAGLDIQPVDEPVQHLRCELLGPDLRERAAALPDRRADGIDDVRVPPSTTA